MPAFYLTPADQWWWVVGCVVALVFAVAARHLPTRGL